MDFKDIWIILDRVKVWTIQRRKINWITAGFYGFWGFVVK
jgi:hypothetical protein